MAGCEGQPSGQIVRNSIFEIHDFIRQCFQSNTSRQEVEQYMEVHFGTVPGFIGTIWRRLEGSANQRSRMQRENRDHPQLDSNTAPRNNKESTVPATNLAPEVPLQLGLNVTPSPSQTDLLPLFPLGDAKCDTLAATGPDPNLQPEISLLPGLNVAPRDNTAEVAQFLSLPTLQLNLNIAKVYNQVAMLLDPRTFNQQPHVPQQLALNVPGNNPHPSSLDVFLRLGQSISTPRSAFCPYQSQSPNSPPTMAQDIGLGNASTSAFRGNVNVPGGNLQIASGGSIHGSGPNNHQEQQQPQPQQQQQQEVNNAGILMDQNGQYVRNYQ